MKITLNIPDSVQQDLMTLGAKLEIPMEKVIVSCMSVGSGVIQDNPKLQEQLKEHWKGRKKS